MNETNTTQTGTGDNMNETTWTVEMIVWDCLSGDRAKTVEVRTHKGRKEAAEMAKRHFNAKRVVSVARA